MYMKMTGSLFLLGAAASIGFLKAEELKMRVKNLRELRRMILLLQGELRFCHAALSEAFAHVSERVEEPYQSFLKETAEQLEMRNGATFRDIWNDKTNKLLCAEGFQKEDVCLLELLGSSLGYLDLAMQTETLNLAIIRTEEAVHTAKKQLESKGRLYQTMGITVGALLTLLII